MSPNSDSKTGTYSVHRDYVTSAEELEILRTWGRVFYELDTGKRQPQSDRQRTFVSEVSGRVTPASISSKVWLRYKRWMALLRPHQVSQVVAPTPAADRDCHKATPDDAEKYLRERESDAEWQRWLKEHQFDDFR